MVTGIIGRKVGMTQLFLEDGTVAPATVLQAGPCVVVQGKNAETDGYEAVQLGLVEPQAVPGEQGDRRPLQEGQRAADARASRSEAWPRAREAPKLGEQVLCSIFNAGERVDVVGTSKGSGLPGHGEAASLSRRRQDRTARCSTARRARLAPRRIPRACCRGCACTGTWAWTA